MNRLEQLRKQQQAVRDGLRHLAGLDEQTDEQRASFDWLFAEDEFLTGEVASEARREEKRGKVRSLADEPGATEPGFHAPNINTRTCDAFDLSGLEPSGPKRDRELRGRAIDVIADSTRFTSDDHRKRATEILEREGHKPGLAELTLLRSDERYADAFLRAAFDPFGPNAEDRQVMERVAYTQRAMALSDVTGVLVPAHLDPTLILSNNGSTNPFRQVCRSEVGTGNVYRSLSSAGITASYDAEAAEVSDDAPSFSNPLVTSHMWRAFVPISIEGFEDARGRESEIVMLIIDAKDTLEATKFAIGSGTNEPRGLITALDANTNVEVNNTTSNVFGLEDVYALYEALPPRWRNDSTVWFADLPIINDIRQFGTEDYHTQTVQLGARRLPAVLGHAILEASAMDGAITAAGQEEILVVGDPRQFLIYDRIGMSVELIPHLFHTSNNRPSGQRGWFAHGRNGSNTVVDTAFRLLLATTNS